MKSDSLITVLAVGSAVAALACFALARSGREGAPRSAAIAQRDLDGFRIRLVAVGEPHPNAPLRAADHSWTPDGVPYKGSAARLSRGWFGGSNGEGSSRIVYFELEPLKGVEPSEKPLPPTKVDVIGYLPHEGLPAAGAGPSPVEFWNGVPRDSEGKILLRQPQEVAMSVKVQEQDPQPVDFGIAQGDYKTVASGPITLPTLKEGETSILVSGKWGRIEVTHRKRPMAESRPSPTDSFSFLGGQYPPSVERKMFLYDSKGAVVITGGEGETTSGFWNPGLLGRKSPPVIERYEIVSRPYHFVQFNGVQFNPPSQKAYSGTEGLDHAVDSPIGKVAGILKPSNDQPWTGSTLYASDGTRWIDPSPEFSGYGEGIYDSWNRPAETEWQLLFQPKGDPTSSPPMKCKVYAADSPNGPAQEKLAEWGEEVFRLPISQISCKPTARPYLQLELSEGDGAWKTVETIPITTEVLKKIDAGLPGTQVVGVMFRDDGTIDVCNAQQRYAPVAATWKPGEQTFRAIAHLHDGETVDVGFNESSIHDRGLDYQKQTDGSFIRAGARNIDIKDIESFEFQVQNLKPAISIPIHTPLN